MGCWPEKDTSFGLDSFGRDAKRKTTCPLVLWCLCIFLQPSVRPQITAWRNGEGSSARVFCMKFTLHHKRSQISSF